MEGLPLELRLLLINDILPFVSSGYLIIVYVKFSLRYVKLVRLVMKNNRKYRFSDGGVRKSSAMTISMTLRKRHWKNLAPMGCFEKNSMNFSNFESLKHQIKLSAAEF